MVWLPFKSDVALSPDISTYSESLDLLMNSLAQISYQYTTYVLIIVLRT